MATTPSRARPRGAARREALLDAVLRIVAEVGADAITHRRVAEEAGLPLASTTYYFESKEHLLTAALEHAAERDVARLHAFLGHAPWDVPDPLGLVVDAILDPLQDNDLSCRASLLATYVLMLEAARRPALREIIRRWTEAYLDALSRLLERAGSTDSRSDAAILLAAADGLLLEQLASDRTAEIAPQLRRLAAALVKP
jgi:TetR/AcrR family transcriptional regulator, regulator of biofilm formation and stress response